MKPGLTRAVPAAILGFLGGALFVILLRSLQSVDPIWDPEIGMVMAVFSASAVFVWGMGGFNPAMNAHPHEPEVDHETGLILAEPHEETVEETEASPTYILGYSIWQISFWIIVLLVCLAAAATLSGFFLQTTSDPAASRDSIGFVRYQLPFGGPEVLLSQLTLFIVFIVITMATLAVVGGLIAYGFYGLSGQVAAARASENLPINTNLAALPANAGVVPAEEDAELVEDAPAVAAQRPSALRWLFEGVRFVVVFVVLYLLFFYVLIGLILPEPRSQLIILSLVNALVITLLLLYTRGVLRFVGRVAGWLANVLRRAPSFLFQR
ncbi:MAG: hypothetical protein OHK0046_19270 [Anaerolineae bacterium]